MEKLRWGIIGCGNVTEVKSGPAFNKVKNSELVAVMRRDEEKVKGYAQRHGVPKWYTDAQQLINDPDINAIYIATPPDSHLSYTLAALQAGKPVYVEKPMTLNAMEAQKMADAARQQDIKLSVAHYRREQPFFKKIKELLQSSYIGVVKLINLQQLQPYRKDMITATDNPWRIHPEVSGGGLFHDLAPHQLDLMLYFFGPAQEVQGMALNQARLYEADDTVCGTIRFQKDILFNGLWCFTTPASEAKENCEIIGTEGKISFSVFGDQTIYITKGDQTETLRFDPPQHVQQPMIEKVVAYFLDEGPNPCSAEEGVQVMQWMDVITKKKN
jgi:predicted dehydrogenase